MPIVLDLNTKIIPDDKKIWVVHTGKNSNRLDTFLQENCVFLEYPDLKLNESNVSDDDYIRQRIRYSRAIRQNKGPIRADGTTISLTSFSGKPGDDVSIPLRTVKHLTSRIQPDDLIIVPGKGAKGRILIGEADGTFFPETYLRVPGISYSEVPARKVRWISTDRAKLDLPPNLISIFEKPPAIAEVPRDPISNRFFEYAYDSYILGNFAWLLLQAPKYDGRDIQSIIDEFQLIQLGISLYNAQMRDESVTGLTFNDIISQYYDDGVIQDLKTRYSSPGRTGIKDKDKKLCLFLSGFICLAISGSLSACKSDPNALSVTNKQQPSVHSREIQDMVNIACHDMDPNTISDIEKKGKNAYKKSGLTTPAKVK